MSERAWIYVKQDKEDDSSVLEFYLHEGGDKALVYVKEALRSTDRWHDEGVVAGAVAQTISKHGTLDIQISLSLPDTGKFGNPVCLVNIPEQTVEYATYIADQALSEDVSCDFQDLVLKTDEELLKLWDPFTY